jgi:hypothetical protein
MCEDRDSISLAPPTCNWTVGSREGTQRHCGSRIPSQILFLTFDIKINTGRGCVFAACFRRQTATPREFGLSNIRMSILQAHRRLGHSSEDITRQSAAALGWKITRGSLGACEACAIAKAQQKNVVKVSDRPNANQPNERVFMERHAGSDVALLAYHCG